jgi:hypothetical protein
MSSDPAVVELHGVEHVPKADYDALKEKYTSLCFLNLPRASLLFLHTFFITARPGATNARLPPRPPYGRIPSFTRGPRGLGSVFTRLGCAFTSVGRAGAT